MATAAVSNQRDNSAQPAAQAASVTSVLTCCLACVRHPCSASSPRSSRRRQELERRRENTRDWSSRALTHRIPMHRCCLSCPRPSPSLPSLLCLLLQSAFLGAIAVADLVKTTLGPKGMDKLLQPVGGAGSGGPRSSVAFTNDGATILKSIPIDNPAAKIIVDTSKTQDIEIGDGTTSVAVLAGELLREAESLILSHHIHPQIIIRGWRKAIVAARQALEASAISHSADAALFRQDLIDIAKTTLSSKILAANKDHFALLAVDAVLRLKGSTDLSSVQLVKIIGGNMRDSYLEDGFVLAKKIGVGQPKRIVDAKILVANTALDTDKIKIFGAKVKADGVETLAEIETAEREKMRQKVHKILGHGSNVFISRQLIYNFPEQLFTEHGVTAIEHADFEGIERLALVLGAEIVSTFDHPERVKLGSCKLVEEIVIGEDKVIRFSGVERGEACSIILRGASNQILDEAERSLHDALCVLIAAIKNPHTVYGGGCSEMLMAKAVDELSLTVAGKESLAIDAFAKALRSLPMIIADNAGYDSSELMTQLRAKHHSEVNARWGLDMESGGIGDMKALAITEALTSKLQVVISAHEAAEMIVRVDDIIKCAPRQRKGDHRH